MTEPEAPQQAPASVYKIVLTGAFNAWLINLPDPLTRNRLEKRLQKVQAGNFGDVKPVGQGVWEMREHFGPGWRMYYTIQGQTVVMMLGGGSKSTQQRDIAKALALHFMSEPKE